MLINDTFIYLPIPKNASTSIIYSILHWKIKVDFGDKNLNELMFSQIDTNNNFEHFHNTHSFYKKIFPNKKTIGIKRPSADRFISALQYLIIRCKIENVSLKYDFQNMNEEEIIDIFSNIFYELDKIGIPNELNRDEFIFNAKKINKKYISDDINFNRMYIDNFRSQYFWGLNDCDRIINIENILEFVNIIKEIKPSFNLIKNNKSNHINLKIEKTENLLNFVHNIIDSKYI
jgi:hypothetical protein